MPKQAYIQAAFNAGIFSPLLKGNIKLAQREDALEECQNMIPLKQGPITRRGGSSYVKVVKDSSVFTRLMPFQFNTTQAYQIEAGNNYFRFYKDYGIITQTAQDITAITKANPAVVTYSGSDTYANGDRVVITGVLGMTEVNNREFTVANVDTGANTFELSGINSTAYTTYTSGGTVAEIVELVTTYATADLPELRYTQSADVLYIVNEKYKPRVLTRSAHTSWAITDLIFTDGPYLPANTLTTGVVDTALTITPSGTTGSITLTASSALFTVTTDIGRLVRFKDSANNWTWLEITATASSTSVTATVKGANLASAVASSTWRLGLYSITSGFPRTVTFFQDRIVLGGTTSYPNRVDFSKTSGYSSTTVNMSPTAADGTVADDNAFSRTISSNQVNQIRWMVEDSKGLVVGTSSAEWLISTDDFNGTITPSNARPKQLSTKFGSIDIQPAEVGNAILFAQKSGRKIGELSYLFEKDGFEGKDMTVLAESITKGGITDMAYQQDPINVLWCARGDGKLLGFTYLAEQKIKAWHYHKLGGTDTVVESVSVIPSPDGTRDDLWLIVKRTINGGTVRYIEYLTRYYEDDIALEDATCFDSLLTYDGTATTTISGLNHLIGQTVGVLADGSSHPDCTVSSTGTITLNAEYEVVQIGLKNIWRIYTMQIEGGSANGTAQGKTKRISKLIVRYLNTLGVLYGSKKENGTEELDEDTFDYGLQMGSATPLFSGDRVYPFPDGYNRNGQIILTNEGSEASGFPVTILSIMPTVNTQDSI